MSRSSILTLVSASFLVACAGASPDGSEETGGADSALETRRDLADGTADSIAKLESELNASRPTDFQPVTWFFGGTLVEATQKARKRDPDAKLYSVKLESGQYYVVDLRDAEGQELTIYSGLFNRELASCKAPLVDGRIADKVTCTAP